MSSKAIESQLTRPGNSLMALCYAGVALCMCLYWPLTFVSDELAAYSAILRFDKIEPAYLAEAYAWTCYALLSLIACQRLLGTGRNFLTYLRKPLLLPSRGVMNLAWVGLSLASALSLALIYFQAGFRFPLFEVVGLENAAATHLRFMYEQTINQTLFQILVFGINFALVVLTFVVGKLSLLKRVVSFGLVIAPFAFALAKSPLLFFSLQVLLYAYTLGKISTRQLLMLGLGALCLAVPWFAVQGFFDTGFIALPGRVLGGQWAGFVHALQLFDAQSVEFVFPLPPYLGGEPLIDTNPGRLVLGEIIGTDQLDISGAGVASTLFVSDPFAWFGRLGIVIAPLYVSVVVWWYSRLFAHLPRSMVSVALYCWVVMKFAVGLITGLSTFFISSFTFVLIVLTCVILLMPTAAPTTENVSARRLVDTGSAAR